MKLAWRLLPPDPHLGWVPLVWVLYVGFVFLVPVLGEFASAQVWWASTAVTVLFLPLYFSAYWVTGWRQLVLAVLIALLGVALAPVNTGASTFFVYAAYFAGLSQHRIRDAALAIGLVIIIAGLTAATLAPTIYFAGPTLLGVVIVGFLGSHFAQQRVRQAELHMARGEVAALARIAERDRIAGDLHDLLGHTLSVIALKSELIAAVAQRDAERAGREATEVQGIARRALDEVRTAVRGYTVGAGAGLRQELKVVESSLGSASVEFIVEGGPERFSQRLDAAREGVLALAVREATTNVIRHADAKRCWIEFFDDHEVYGVEIRDDGRGLRGRPGHGLLGMRRRVEALGGQLSLRRESSGTRLRLSFARPGEPAEARA